MAFPEERLTDAVSEGALVDLDDRAQDELVIDVRTEDGAIVVYVSGELDMTTCEALRDAIEPHMGPAQTIVLDLSGVRFMDSSSLHFLLQARGTLTADGGSLVLRNPSTAAHLLLSAAGLAHHLLEDWGKLGQ